ncbi:MAG: tRNA dihydrouridine synthase DusB [Myxococcales bacterium]|nr:tRNA dihydrouridine synthase DusB [Myxococcales bacterium]
MVSVAQLQAPAGALSRLGPLRVGGLELGAPIIMAPMAGVSEAPYRALAMRMGAGSAPTELVSSKGLLYKNERTEAYLRHDPAQEPALWVQIFGGEPESMAVGAELAASRGARLLDVNMGCPVKKVTRNGAGSALMTDPARAAAIVRAMREAVGDAVPVTAKIRAGWDPESRNAVEVGKALEDAGAAAVTLHPRTRSQGYSGTADWSLIRDLKEALRIPVIANGDVFCAADAHRVVDETGCDGVMVGRAALGNPWVFRELAAAYRGEAAPEPVAAEERVQVILQHLADHLEHIEGASGGRRRHGEPEAWGLKKFRQHLIWYSRGMRGGAAFRERAMGLDEREAVEALVAAFFGAAEQLDVSEAPIYDERTAFG